MPRGVYKKSKKQRNLIAKSIRAKNSLNQRSEKDNGELANLKNLIREKLAEMGCRPDEDKLSKVDFVEFYRPKKEYSKKRWANLIIENNWDYEDIKGYWFCKKQLEDSSTYVPPEWHKWVYGGCRNPMLDIKVKK